MGDISFSTRTIGHQGNDQVGHGLRQLPVAYDYQGLYLISALDVNGVHS